MEPPEAVHNPVLVFASLAAGVDPEVPEIEEFTAIIEPAVLSDSESRGTRCTIDALEAEMTAAIVMLNTSGTPYRFTQPEPPFQQIVVDFGWVSVWDAVSSVRELFSGLAFEDPQYFYTLSGDATRHPDFVVTHKTTTEFEVYSFGSRQVHILTIAPTDAIAVTTTMWDRFYDVVKATRVFGGDVEMIISSNDGQIDYAIKARLTDRAAAIMGSTIIDVLKLFPRF